METGGDRPVFGRKKRAPRYEYKTVKVSGTFRLGGAYSKAVEKQIKKQAKKGWELDRMEEMGRGKNRGPLDTISTRYVVLVFKREKR
jgi:hypothetical protein